MMEFQETIKALGGRLVLGKEVLSGTAFVQSVERGLPRSTLSELKRFAHLSDADLTMVIPRRTLSSIKSARRLTAEQSDRVARTAGIASLAKRVFGDAETAREWLLLPNPTLDGSAPLRLLRTGSGAQLVEAILLRIEYGVYE